jgi:hypothetical protein
MALAAILVLVPGVPLGLLTEGVQTLAGVLLPSATVFLLLLCNDREVLGPWVNSRGLNVFTSAVIWVLVLLSVVLIASVLFPGITSAQIVGVLVGGGLAGAAGGGVVLAVGRRRPVPDAPPAPDRPRATWRMPALHLLSRPVMSTQRKLGLVVLRVYLVAAFALVSVKVVEVAVH